MRRQPDPAVLVATMQVALDLAHQRIRDSERIIAMLNERLTTQTEARDAAEMQLLAMTEQARHDAQNGTGATPPIRDVSPYPSSL